VTEDGTIFVGHSDTTVKMYRPDSPPALPAPLSPAAGPAPSPAAAPPAIGTGAAGAAAAQGPQPAGSRPLNALGTARPESGLTAALRGGAGSGGSSPAPSPPPAAQAVSLTGLPPPVLRNGSSLSVVTAGLGNGTTGASSGGSGPATVAAPSPAMSVDEAALPPRWACGGPMAAASAAAATASGRSTVVASPVERVPDAVTDTAHGHVGPVNSLVVCGPYICSAGGSRGAGSTEATAAQLHAITPAARLLPLPLPRPWSLRTRHPAPAPFTAGGDAMVRVWRASDLSLVRVLRGHRGSVLCLLAVGHLLLSGARDNAIRWAARCRAASACSQHRTTLPYFPNAPGHL
jgi:hypothetical protein